MEIFGVIVVIALLAYVFHINSEYENRHLRS